MKVTRRDQKNGRRRLYARCVCGEWLLLHATPWIAEEELVRFRSLHDSPRHLAAAADGEDSR